MDRLTTFPCSPALLLSSFLVNRVATFQETGCKPVLRPSFWSTRSEISTSVLCPLSSALCPLSTLPSHSSLDIRHSIFDIHPQRGPVLRASAAPKNEKGPTGGVAPRDGPLWIPGGRPALVGTAYMDVSIEYIESLVNATFMPPGDFSHLFSGEWGLGISDFGLRISDFPGGGCRHLHCGPAGLQSPADL